MAKVTSHKKKRVLTRKTAQNRPEATVGNERQAPGESKTVVWVTGKHVDLLSEDGTQEPARFTRPHWPVVGDRVRLKDSKHGLWVKAVEPRRSVLRRGTPGRPRGQVLAANIDILVIVTAAGEQFRAGLVDRLLVAARSAFLEPLLVVNKSDLEELMEWTEEDIELYEDLGVTVVRTSAVDGEGLNKLREHVATKNVALVGHSGVGKSSILNELVPGANREVGELSERTRTGRHITSSARAFPLPEGGLLIDMPGLRLFGMVDMGPADLAATFHEFAPYLGKCRFPNCTHSHEPDCAVMAAVEEGGIWEQRYDSYLRLLEELEEL